MFIIFGLIFILFELCWIWLLIIAKIISQADFDEVKPYLINGTIVIVILSLLFTFCTNMGNKIDIKNYNNGYCTECNGKLELYDIETFGRYGRTRYYYQCEDCKHIVATDQQMN